MAKSIGIDLGTTNSVAAIKRLDVTTLLNDDKDEITKSCVAYRSGRFVVGKAGIETLKLDPQNTVRSVKRLMGRELDDSKVQDLIHRNKREDGYRIVPRQGGTENSLAIMLGGQEYTPEQISAEILKEIERYASKALGDEVRYAVITVPAYFNDRQRHATRMAAHLSGFQVLRLLPEPTAAAISFGIDEMTPGEAKTVLIYDFGGGTFDLSVLTIADGQFIEQGKGGDMWLGGDDLDEKLRNYVYTVIEAEYGISDLDACVAAMPEAPRYKFLGTLREKIEQVKIRLSQAPKATLDVLGMLQDLDGDFVDIVVEITRETFNRLIAETIDRTVALCHELIADIHYTPDLIDDILLIGGSSAVPLVREKLSAAFGPDKVHVHPRPMLAVAEGAAIYAHRLAETVECPGCGRDVPRDTPACPHCGFDLAGDAASAVEVVHTVSHDYFIRLEDGTLYPLLERNMPLPASAEQVFVTAGDNQHLIHAEFFNTVNGVHEPVGSLWLNLDRGYPRGTEILVRADVGEDGVLSTTAALRKNPGVKVSRGLARGGEAIERALTELSRTINYVNAGGFLKERVHEFLDQCPGLVDLAYRIENPDTMHINMEILEEYTHRLHLMKTEVASKYRNVEDLVQYTDMVLESYQEWMGTQTTQRLIHLRDNLVRVSRHGNKAEIDEAYDELDHAIDAVPTVVLLMHIRRAQYAILNTDPARASRLDMRHDQILKALLRNDSPTANQVFDEAWPDVRDILNDVDNVYIPTQLTLNR